MYHAELLALQTPDLHKIVSTGRGLLLLNHRQHGARRGLLVSGGPHYRQVHGHHLNWAGQWNWPTANDWGGTTPFRWSI